MRLLVVGFQYPPNANPRAVRWGAVTRRWAELGHEVDVVCGPGDDVPNADDSGRLRVFRTGGWIDRLKHRFRRASGDGQSRTESGAARRPSIGQRVKRFGIDALRQLHDHTYARLRWPDYAGSWIGPATRTARRLLDSNRYDALVSVSNPFSGHVVGFELKRAFPKLPWMADIGDPFTFAENSLHNDRRFHERNLELETAVLDSADVTTTVTDCMIARYAVWFPGRTGRMHTVPPILADPPAPVGRQLDPARRAVVFSGMLFRQLRNPASVLRLFARIVDSNRLPDVDLHFFGNVGDCGPEFEAVESLVGRRVHLHGEVPHAVVWQALRESHVLLNLGVAIRFGLPTKLLEYSAAGRPILHLGFQSEDPALPFLARHPAALGLDTTVALENAATFDHLVRFIDHPPTVDREQIESLVEPHRVGPVAARYLDLLTPHATASRAA